MKLGMAKPEHPPTLDEKTSGYGVGVEPGTAAVAPAAGTAAEPAAEPATRQI